MYLLISILFKPCIAIHDGRCMMICKFINMLCDYNLYSVYIIIYTLEVYTCMFCSDNTIVHNIYIFLCSVLVLYLFIWLI